jgi:hypothetical protein
MPTNVISGIRMVAFQMARSGSFVDCPSIETALERSGHSEAGVALGEPAIRVLVDKLCIEHWRGVAG